jgi:predicted nucleic acid-binding protein
MIVFDTNLVSEIAKLRDEMSPTVLGWLDQQPLSECFTTAITVAELRTGLLTLPLARRRSTLEASVNQALSLFSGRVLPFDASSAEAFAEIASAKPKSQRSRISFDLQIAAIARANGMAVATRNVADFADTGVDIIDPWSAAA